MRKSRRLLAMLLAVMMAISALPLGIFAEDKVVWEDEQTPEVSVLPTVGFYDACQRSNDTWLGNGSDHVIQGAAGETKTVYCLWDTGAVGTVASVSLSYEDVGGDGDVLLEVPLEKTADTLAAYGVTVTPQLGEGYIQVETGFSDSSNLEIFLMNGNGERYSAHLSIDEKRTSDGGEEEETPVVREVDLYWSKFHGMYEGAPDYSTDYAADFMWDEVGQDINAVFLFWDGETFSEVHFAELSFPKGLTYSQNEEYANAVYMVFDKALVGDITYTKDGQTYAFPLEVEDLTGEEEEVSLPEVAYFSAPERTAENWIQNEVVSGVDGGFSEAFLMWDTTIFTVDEQSDVKVYLVKNGDKVVAVDHQVWDEGVDHVLYQYGVSLNLDPDDHHISVFADYSSLNGTLDFSLTLTDRNGDIHEAQLSIDKVEEEASLKWCWVNRENGVYLPQTDYLNNEIWMELGDEQLMAVYLEQGEEKTLIPYEDLIFEGEGFSTQVNEEDERFFDFCAESSGTGGICCEVDGTTYSFPVEVALPNLGFFSRPERCDDAFVGNTLTYTGENDVYYVILRDEKVIQSVEIVWQDQTVTDEQIRVVIADDGTYAELHLGENLQLDKTHNITVQYSNGSSSRVFRFRNGKAGLRWCWVNDDNEEYTLRLDSLNDEFLNVYDRGNGSSKAFCFCEGDQVTPMELQDLEFPSFLEPEIRFEDQDMDWYLTVKYNGLGSGDIIYRKDGVEYALPARVDLPDLGLYTEARRAEETYTYKTLDYTGENTVYYLFAPEDWSVTEVSSIPAFVTVSYPADGGYALVTLNEGFETNEWYELAVSYQNADGYSISYTTDFEIRDTRAGLRWCWVNGNSDDLTADIDNLRTELNRGITPYGRNWMAFCFEENGQVELLDGEDLNFPDLVDVERINENQPQYLGVQFQQFGTGEITYERNGVIYRLPVEVTLPGLGFYHEPVRSQETYAEPLVFDGKDEAGNAVETETFYLMLENDYEVIDLKFSDGQPDYVSYEIMDGYAAVTIGAGADEEWQDIEVTYGDSDVPNWTNTWWAGFRVKNESPGLRWCWVNRHNSQYEPQVEDLERKLWLDLGDEARIAVYLQDGEHKTLIPYEKLQFEGSCFHDEALSDHEDYFYLYSDACGQGKVVYEAGGITYSLPVEAGLPHLGFYTSAERSEETFAGTELAYTGDNDVYYAILGNDYPIQRAEILLDDQPVDEDEIKIEISADGTYATVTLGEEVRDGESYRVYLHYNNGNYSGRSFRVLDNRPGLRWVYLRWDDNDNLYEDMEDVRSDLDYSMNNSVRAAFYFVDGDKWERLSPEVLQFPDFLKLEQMEEHEDYVRVRFRQFGSGEVTYTRDGVTYSIPASVGLPDVSFYSQPVRSEETYLGEELPFDGKDDKGNTAATETFYLMMMDGWEVTEVEFEDGQPDFVSYEIVDGYAAVTVSAGFDGEYYDIRVYAAWENDADRTDDWWANFEVVDERPGLRWVYLRWDDNDNLYEDMKDVRSDLDYSMNSNVRAAFYFVDGDKWERLSPEVLQFPDFLTVKQMEEGPDYVRVGFEQFGSGEVTYERDGVTYSMPASVSLPGMGYYTEPVRSEATYMGDELIFDGKDEAGNPVTEETFYLMAQDSWNITELEFTDGQPDFVSYEIVDGYAVITISEGFNDEWYEVKAYCQHENDPDNTDWWWADFEIRDNRPGLKWKWVDFGGDGQFPFVPEDEEFQSVISHRVDSGVTVAVYYVDGDTEVLIPKNKLILPDFVEIEPNTDAEGGDYFFWLSFLTVGEGEITCADYPGCGLPVVSELPFIALYSQPEAKEEYLLNSKNLSLDFSEEEEDGRRYATVYIVPAQEDWTLTGLQMGGNGNDDPTDFVDYAVNKAENYIELKVYDEYVPDWYSLSVFFTYPNGEAGDRWVEFRLADKPILQWMQVMEADGSYAITGGSRSLSLQPGESQLMAVCYTYNNDMVPLDYDDLIFPDFLSVEQLDEDDPTLLRVLCTGLGEGSITSKTYPDLRLRVVSSREMLGYYTQPEMNGDYLNNRLNSEEGEDIVRWLIWDPDQLADVTDVTLTLKNEEHTILVDDVRASGADLSQWGITVTLDLEAGHMKLVAREGDWYNLTAKVWQGEKYERITVNLNSDPNEWGHIWDDGYPTITYQGVPYSFFITECYEDMERMHAFSNFGSSGGGTHDTDLVIGAMGWYDTDKEEEAPEEVLKAIKNVQFRIGKFHNFDASGDQLASNFKLLEEVEHNLHGKPLYGNKVASYDGMYVYAEFIATFTVELPGMEPQTFTMNTIGHRLPDRSIDLDMTSLTTAEELNAVLSSGEALENWLKINQPSAYAQYMALDSTGMRAMSARFSATLAPVVFEDVIVVSNEHVWLNLSGSVDEEGNRTTMPGMWLKNHDTSFIEGIDFVADAGKTMAWGKEKAFTCGILAGGEDRNSGDAYGGDAYGVDDCTFTGFDYGIRCTEYSYTAPGNNCVFTDCEIGYYVDCGKKTGGNANSDVTYCSFINCGTAIRIKALPTYVSPYDLVISNNDFINNKWDIDLSVRGRFFFNGNYYGETADGSVPEVRADCIYRTARVHGRGYATIIVNPRWQLPCTFAGPNKLVMDTHKGLNNYMINENADKNPIDSKTLAYDLGLYTEAELMRIIMTDDSENTLGTWTFSGTKDSESLSLLDAAAEADDTFNAELIFGEDAEGSTTVTIQDSSILSGGNVKLTVPCTFLDAKVTVNGREVDASVANGQVTFTVIGGGTYVIHEVELEEIEDAFITGGAAESNPDAGNEPVTQPKAEVDMGWYNYDHSETGEDTAPKFATVTTEEQQVAKEIDPDADLDQVVGDEKVEEKTETTQIVTVQAIYQAPAAAEPGDTVSDVVVLLVLYDKTGQMIAMHQQVAQQSDGTRVITVQCDAALLSSNAVTVKAFVISASGDMRPLAPVPFSQTLTFDAN